MKQLKTTLFLLIAFMSSNAYSQTVGGIPLDSLTSPYIMIVGTGKFLQAGVNVDIDWGQETKFFSSKKEYDLVDEKGKRIDFNSMIDAMNFLHKFGYRFKDAYAITINSSNVYHWIMEKGAI